MKLRRLALLGWGCAGGLAVAQAAPSPADDHAAQIAARYEAMLVANPAEGIALERLWKGAQDRGQTDDLIERHKVAASALGASSADALIYGGLLRLAGRLDEAMAAFRQAAARDAGSPRPLVALAEMASARGKPDEAAAFYDSALAKSAAGEQTDLLFKLGAARLAAGRPKEAAETWERLVARDPDDAALRRRLVRTYEENGLPEPAIVHLEYLTSHAEPAERALAFRDLARLRETRGDFEPAREALESGLALTARDNWLHAELGLSLIRLYQRAGRAPELQARWEAEAAKSPKDLDLYARLETLAREQGDPAAQRRWLERVVALAPGDREDARRLARLLAEAGERERAAAMYDAFLKNRPRDLEIVLARADLDVQMGREPAAVARLEAPGDDAWKAAALEFFLRHHLDAAAERRLRGEAAAGGEEPSLALAKFLFSRRKPAEGRAALEAFIAAAPDPAARVHRLERAAEGYRQADQTDDALRCWDEAARFAPDSPAPLAAAANALAARGDAAGAAERMRRAVDLTPAGPARTEADHRLFGLLNSAPPASADAGRTASGFSLRHGPAERRGSLTPAAAEQIRLLAAAAGDHPSVDNFLRLARWQSWARFPREAAAAAERAVALEPSSLPAHEFLVSLATESGDRGESVRRIGEMLTADPEHKAHWLKALADLRIEDGDLDRALAFYQQLVRESPASFDALSDLAIAQQRAGRWYDAELTWERAYALAGATPQQRADARRPLLAALERLGEFPRARDILQAATDRASTLAEQRDEFHQLADFCARHDLLAPLATHYQERLAAQPQDFFTLTALAELRRGEQSYALLTRALYSSPDPAETLRALVNAAEALGHEEAAIAHQRHLVALSQPDSSEASEKLAALEAANLEDDAAARTWEGIVAKFPRDAGVLGRAADFYEAAGDPERARSALRRLAALGPSDIKRLYRLGRLDAAAGDVTAARQSFYAVLAASAPEKAGEPPQLPPSSTGHEKAPDRTDERTLRLWAIREDARTLAPADRPAWVARWQKLAETGARNEPLWALFNAGAKPETTALLARWVADRPGSDAVVDIFIRLSLRLGDYPAVARWTWENKPDPDRADRMLNGLAQYLIEGGEPDARLVAALFPPGCSRETRWKAASVVFAGRQCYEQAAALGAPVLKETSVNRANYAIEIARWNLLLGRIAEARATLREAIDGSGADSLDPDGDQYFSVLREYWTLLPAGDRAPFAETMLRRSTTAGGPAQSALTRVLIHSLMGNRAAADDALDDLASLRMLGGEPVGGSVDARRWNYLLTNGAQLVAWNLDAAAIHLWRRALLEASAFQRRDPECRDVLGQMRGQLVSAEILTAPDPAQASERLDDYLRSRPEPAPAHHLAAELSNAGQPSLAARIHESFARLEHADPNPVRELLEAYAAAGDSAALQRTLRRLLEESGALGDRPPGLQPADLALRLANELDRDGDPDGACRVLEHQWQATPRAVTVGLALAKREVRAGRVDHAATVLRSLLEYDSGVAARIALADLESSRGNGAEAQRLLAEAAARTGDPAHTAAAARLVALRLAEGAKAGAIEAARDPACALEAAKSLEAARNPAGAREFFLLALRHATEPGVRFAAQRGLLATTSAAALPREINRLRRIAGDDGMLLVEWENARYQQARSHGLDAWLEGELRRDWEGGAGSAAAGAKLVDLCLATGQSARLSETVAGIVAHNAPWEPTAFDVQAALTANGRADLALSLVERLARRLPQDERFGLAWIRALVKTGQPAKADAVAEQLSAAGDVRGNINERIAGQFLADGDKVRALDYYRRVEPGTSAGTHLALARLETAGGDLATARLDLRQAYRLSETADLNPLVDWLGAAGRLEDERRAPGGDYPLTLRRRGDLAVLIFDRLAQQGNAAAARRMALAHPELLGAAPELAGRLCAGAEAAERPAIAAALENALAQSDPPPPRLERELAALCVQRAKDSPAEAAALLARARQLRAQDERGP